jgi:triosephosphate isomerase
MRKKIIAGNWKMNTTPAQGLDLAKSIANGRKEIHSNLEFVIFPPFTHLAEIVRFTHGTGLSVGAQNCAAEAKGAYTGEISAGMLAALGVEFVILGHSERREYFGETAETLNKKMEQAYLNHLIPIFCIGEKLEDREAGKEREVIAKQIKEVVYQLSPDQIQQLVIAYEPVWAIGTGKTASAEQAQEMHAYIREVVKKKFGAMAEDTPILYGGSVTPKNSAQIFAQPDVDGGLIGGASLVADDFLDIGKSYKKIGYQE